MQQQQQQQQHNVWWRHDTSRFGVTEWPTNYNDSLREQSVNMDEQDCISVWASLVGSGKTRSVVAVAEHLLTRPQGRGEVVAGGLTHVLPGQRQKGRLMEHFVPDWGLFLKSRLQ